MTTLFFAITLIATLGHILAQPCNLADPIVTPADYTCSVRPSTLPITNLPNFPSGPVTALSAVIAVKRTDNCSVSTFNYLTFSQIIASPGNLIVDNQHSGSNFVTRIGGTLQATLPTVTDSGEDEWVQFAFSIQFGNPITVRTTIFTSQGSQTVTGTWNGAPTLDGSATLFLCSGNGEIAPIGCEIRFLKVIFANLDPSYLLEPAPQLIGWYRLQEGVDQELGDSSGVMGYAYLGAGSSSSPDPSSNNRPKWSVSSDNGLIYTGSEYISLPSTFALQSSSPVCTASLTLNMWLKPTQFPAASSVYLFRIYDTSSGNEIFALYIQSGGILSFYITGMSETTFGSALTTGVWASVSFSFVACKGGSEVTYQYNINGVISAQIPTSASFVVPSSYSATIGYPTSFTGILGLFEIYSPGTITAHRSGDVCYDSSVCTVKVGLTNPITCLMVPTSSCDSSCGSCAATGPSGCISCSSGSNVVQRGYCQCTKGNYYDQGSCSSCALSGCTACLDAAPCQACNTNLNLALFDGTCSTCASGKYADIYSECQDCSSPCANCTGSATSCDTCIPGYDLSSNTCTLCTTGPCSNCDSPCSTCSGLATSCDSCISGYTLDTRDNTCQSTTTDDNSTDTNTTLCSSGQYYYSDGSCKTTCNSPYTARNDSGTLYCDLCTSSNTAYSTSDGSSTTLYYYPSDGICRYICPSPFYVKTIGALTNCELPLTTEQKATVQSLSSSSSTAADVVTASVFAVTVFTPYDPNGISSGSLSKLFEYTRYFDVTRSAKLEEFYADNRATPGAVTIGPDLSTDIVLEVPYYPVAPIMAMNNLHSNFFVNFFPNLESLLIISGGILVVLGIELLMKRYLAKFLVYYQKIRIAAIAFLVTQFYNVYAEIIFFGIIEYETFETGSGYDWLGLLLAIFFLIFGLVVLFLHARMLRRYQACKAQSPSEEVEKRLEAFKKSHENVENLFKDFKDISFICQSYLWLVAVRTIVCNIFLSALYDYPMPQVIVMMVINLAMIVYLIWKRPYINIFGVFQQLAFEIDLLATNICFIIMAALDASGSTDDDTRDTLGDIVIITIYISKFLSLITLIPKIIQGIWDVIKKMKKEKEAQKLMETPTSPVAATARTIDELKQVDTEEISPDASPRRSEHLEREEFPQVKGENPPTQSYLDNEVGFEGDEGASPVINVEVRDEMRKLPQRVLKIFM